MADPRVHIGPNTFLKYHAIQYYIVFGPISQWWRITLKINSRIQIRIRNSTLRHTQCAHQVSSDSVHNFLRYRAIYRFWPYLSMVRIHFKDSAIGIQIFTKIKLICPSRTHNLPTKFHPNPSITFWDILLTDTQTNKKNVMQSTTLAKSIKQIWPPK